MTISSKNIAQVITVLKKHVRSLPDPSVTLVGKKWHDPFLVLISCLLSLRTKDEVTLPASERLFALADTPQALARVPVTTIEQAIYPVGFYHTKARRIRGISADIVTRFRGQVPDTMEELLTFMGVGRKTANLVLTEGFGLPGICVDTHVHRISNRFGFVRTRTPYETETALKKALPKRYWLAYNALLVVWGQNVCRPISPHCSACPLGGICGRVAVTTNR